MHYTTTYNQSDRTTKETAALGDALNYLGLARFKKVMRALEDHVDSSEPNTPLKDLLQSMTMSLALTGIQGFPARVMATQAIRTTIKRRRAEYSPYQS